MRTGRTRNVMYFLWQTKIAYRTYQKYNAYPVADQKCIQDIYVYQKCDVCPVADQKCVQDIPEINDAGPVADQKCVQDIPEMRCRSCGRPEMCTGHTRNAMQVLWQTIISVCPRVLQNLPCWRTQKTRNPFQHKILISVLSLSISCCTC